MAGEDRLDRVVRQQGVALDQVRAGVHAGSTVLLCLLSLTWARPFATPAGEEFGAPVEAGDPVSVWSVVSDANGSDPGQPWVVGSGLVLMAALAGCVLATLSATVGGTRAALAAGLFGALGALSLLVLGVAVGGDDGLDLDPTRDVWFPVLALVWVQVAAYRLHGAWR